MQPMDNGQYSEAQLTDVYRREQMAHLERQTKALENIKGTLNFFLIVFLIGLVIGVIFLVAATS